MINQFPLVLSHPVFQHCLHIFTGRFKFQQCRMPIFFLKYIVMKSSFPAELPFVFIFTSVKLEMEKRSKHLNQAMLIRIFIVSKQASGKVSPPYMHTWWLHVYEQVLHSLNELFPSSTCRPSILGASTQDTQPWPLSFTWVNTEAGYAERCRITSTRLVNVG